MSNQVKQAYIPPSTLSLLTQPIRSQPTIKTTNQILKLLLKQQIRCKLMLPQLSNQLQLCLLSQPIRCRWTCQVQLILARMGKKTKQSPRRQACRQRLAYLTVGERYLLLLVQSLQEYPNLERVYFPLLRIVSCCKDFLAILCHLHMARK